MNVVELVNISKTYHLGKIEVPALRRISLSVAQGEFLIIKGQSGSGKSTALNLIGAMDLPDSGEVHIAGRDISKLSDYHLSLMRRKHIGFIFQSFNLIPVLNALENVAYPLRLQGICGYRQKAEAALEQVGLSNFMKHRPTELSGGQIQRVAIARGIVSKPDIILADEPTANLDSETSAQILELLLQLNIQQKLTFIVSTHHATVMEKASRVLELKDGQILADAA
ncbi:ABC transporter ATP-binding protein [bacterium]|nr:ABC transporter ATP-binding protein [bacterium]